jgi:hypothetical protein
MKIEILSLLCSTLVALAVLSPPTRAWSGNDSIIGTWKLVSMTTLDETTGKESHIWGENPIGFLTYTSGGRMSAVLAAAGRRISSESAGGATVEEQAMLFRDSIAYAGRYTVTEAGVIHHVEVATDPTWIGKDQLRFARIDGNRLIISSPPIPNAVSPKPFVFSLVWERVE